MKTDVIFHMAINYDVLWGTSINRKLISDLYQLTASMQYHFYWMNKLLYSNVDLFNLLKTLSKVISKLNENCTFVFRNINALTWYSIRVCDVSRWKLTAMHSVTKDCLRSIARLQYLSGPRYFTELVVAFI